MKITPVSKKKISNCINVDSTYITIEYKAPKLITSVYIKSELIIVYDSSYTPITFYDIKKQIDTYNIDKQIICYEEISELFSSNSEEDKLEFKLGELNVHLRGLKFKSYLA